LVTGVAHFDFLAWRIGNSSRSGEESSLRAITEALLKPEYFSQQVQPKSTPREESTMTASTTRKVTGLQYAATILGAFAVMILAPATAHAVDNNEGPGGGGCHYTDKDGYDIPIDEGQSVIVDGKTVTCTGGTITTSPATKTNAGGVTSGQIGPVVTQGNPGQPPKRSPVLSQNVGVFAQTP
jgi:hypothetical protein